MTAHSRIAPFLDRTQRVARRRIDPGARPPSQRALQLLPHQYQQREVHRMSPEIFGRAVTDFVGLTPARPAARPYVAPLLCGAFV